MIKLFLHLLHGGVKTGVHGLVKQTALIAIGHGIGGHHLGVFFVSLVTFVHRNGLQRQKNVAAIGDKVDGGRTGLVNNLFFLTAERHGGKLLEALFVTLGDVALLLDILFNVAAQHGVTGKAAHIVYVLSYFKAGDLAHHIHIPHLQERAVKRRNSVKRKGEHGSKSHSTYGYRQDELSAQRK